MSFLHIGRVVSAWYGSCRSMGSSKFYSGQGFVFARIIPRSGRHGVAQELKVKQWPIHVSGQCITPSPVINPTPFCAKLTAAFVTSARARLPRCNGVLRGFLQLASPIGARSTFSLVSQSGHWFGTRAARSLPSRSPVMFIRTLFLIILNVLLALGFALCLAIGVIGFIA